ncbi:SDR family NAD(P)-dependent oxidoreductase [Mesorhizobium sp. M2A.F.Ca.ET.037.01.1.1]|uniref:SDR family NAD(P)-dependent oxidoreductase n=1 Tax=Mesorhizobium sp. M2A.F.Ca.ET.037.01.1.1 TaxID=2496748 RepID=UPI000FC9C53F|nr:SDR family NAD(P)-dependent oxidoreductase [Mesorhizobium sp. M2A.F.Ca.ET.037.01.1.1]RUX13750.1 SDR family NAD(P)-dependent oxidoreductase [Mesorhizobium sp. M2A.F.Ca.ET.037.01.1.1]
MTTENTKSMGVAVVTGGATGIGFATVAHLIDAGWRGAFFSQTRERVEAAAVDLRARFPAWNIHADTVDLRDERGVCRFFANVRERWGTVSALVCNAGYSPKGPNDQRVALGHMPLAKWDDVIRVNLTGAFLCCREVLPGMAEARQGRIVLISSLAARTQPKIAGASYVASKSALAGLARSIMSEYAGLGITVNTICPGRVLSNMTGPPERPGNRAALARIPIGRLGRPEDISRVIKFLVRSDSDFINGAIIDVNGGEFAPS